MSVWNGFKVALESSVVFVKKKSTLCRNMLAKLNIQLGGIIQKLLPLTSGTINAFVWKLGK